MKEMKEKSKPKVRLTDDGWNELVLKLLNNRWKLSKLEEETIIKITKTL